jgi:hypothetical protein
VVIGDDAIIVVDAELAPLHDKIKAAIIDNPAMRAASALHGLRGVGKTTLAAVYADRHRGD